MNDTELDDMLNQWKAPEPRAELRARIGESRQPRKHRFTWPSWHLGKGLFAGVAAAAVMCFIGITAAFPQVFAPSSVRFNLRSEYLAFKDDGSSTVTEYRESTAVNGQEIVLEQNFPDSWLMTLHMRFFGVVHRLIGLNHSTPARMASDCSVPGASVAGHETLLGYRATVLQYPDRYREWRSPDLDCITMRWIVEKPGAGGELRITLERRPMTVRMNRPQ